MIMSGQLAPGDRTRVAEKHRAALHEDFVAPLLAEALAPPGIYGVIGPNGAGYAGTAIGMLFKALDNRSIAMRTITAAGGILLVYFLAIAINWAAYTFSIPIEAPYPGLFIFSGIAIIVSVVLMWRLPRHIHP